MSTRRISTLLNATSGDLQSIRQHAQWQLRLQQMFLEVVPAELARSSSVCSIRAGTLFLLAENGAVATKLRQLAPRLLPLFQEREAQVTGIRVDVQVSTRKPLNSMKKQTNLSEAGSAALLALEQQLPESALRAAIDGLLSKHGRKAS